MWSIVVGKTGQQHEWQASGYSGFQVAENLTIISTTFISLALPRQYLPGRHHIQKPLPLKKEQCPKTVIPNYGLTIKTMGHGNISQSTLSRNIWYKSFTQLLKKTYIVVLKALTPFSTQGLVLWVLWYNIHLKHGLEMICCSWPKPLTWRFSVFIGVLASALYVPENFEFVKWERSLAFFIPRFLTLYNWRCGEHRDEWALSNE